MVSTHFHSPRLLVLSLPHLLQEIAYWVISPKDLAPCVRVNRTWHDAITPVLWRYFCLLRQRRIETSPPLQRAVARNARHVRYLVAGSTRLFGNLRSDCTNLRKLSYKAGHISSQVEDESFRDLVQFLKKQQASGKFEAFLTTLFPFESEEQTRNLMQAVPDSVQEMTISVSEEPYYSPDGLMVMLQSCASKRHLQALTIEVDLDAEDFLERFQFDTAFRNRMRLDQETTDTIPDQQHLPNINFTLKQLSLIGNFMGLEDSILFPLLRLCPNLETFDIPPINQDRLNDMAAILRLHCPRLKGFVLNQNDLNDEQLGALRALLDHAASLEVLKLHDCGLVLTSKWIQQILVQCLRLKVLRVTGVIVRTHRDADIIPRTKMGRNRRVLAGLDAMDIIHGEPWTCTDLRVLQLVIRNVPRSERTPPGMVVGMDTKQRVDFDEHLLCEEHLVMAEDESRSVQRQICQQIGSLKWLEELNIGLFDFYHDDFNYYQLVSPVQCQCLELSLATGLDALAGLNELRQLKVVRMNHMMGAKEIEWIVRERVWPKLQLIDGVADEKMWTPLGYVHRNSMATTVVKQWYLTAKSWMEWATVADNPAKWLRRQRPGLVVNEYYLDDKFE
ncbi:hypothetical protein MVEG_00657 [Podila verticillata NRRL 6337]|nr:hypothetical protein MVEG_00657 [Podila verticillata NRRL 6337]